ncbi:hypothetical protein V6Z11_A05G036800 [Gossypium hirsutum]
MKAPPTGFLANPAEGDRKSINSELWHACAGPLVSLPPIGSLVVYFPQGHSEQVAASMQKETDFIPCYPNLPSKLICVLHNVTLHADPETDEVYAQMTLQPVNKYDKEALLASDMGLKQSRQPAEFFCKTLTASDTSTHGGFSVPRRAAEKIFPSLDFSMQPPAQELVARDLHENAWTFRHIYRGQPKRHLLTTGWSVFVSTKRLFAGDSVLFIRDAKSQLLLGLRRANRQQPALSSSVISSDSMHIGILAAAAHAAANFSPFTIFYNPSPSEFVVPLAKYNKAMYTQVSLGMRFRMMFETEESGVRRYMGTVTGISDLDPVRWKNSQWRNLQVGWDESTAGERPRRVSIWEIEPVVSPFFICPPPFFRPRFPKQPGMPDDDSDVENAFKRATPWLGDDFGMRGFFPSTVSSNLLHSNLSIDDPSKLLNFQAPVLPAPNMQFNKANPNQVNQLPQAPTTWSQQILQTPVNQHQQQQPQQQLQQQQPQQPQQQPQPQSHLLHQQQPQPQPSPKQQQHIHQEQRQQPQQQQPLQQQPTLPPQVTNGIVAPNQISNQNLHQPAVYSHLQQQQLLTSNSLSTQTTLSAHMTSYPLTSLPQDTRVQQQMEQQPNLMQRQQQQTQLQQSLSQRTQQQPQILQLSQQGLSEQLQLQLLQKLQQQQQQSAQQLLSAAGSLLQPPMLQQQQTHQQNQPLQQLPLSQSQVQPLGSNGFSTSMFVQPQQLSVHQSQSQSKQLMAMRSNSGLIDGDAPPSTLSSTNNCQVSPSNLINRSHHVPSILMTDPVVEPPSTLAQELLSKPDIQIKHEPPTSRGLDQSKYKSSVTDQLEASSSGTSYCLDAGTIQHNAALSFLEGDVQSHSRNNLPFTANIDGLAPETLLTREYDSQKDLQNMLSNYGGNPRDIDTELSTAAISCQSFGVPNIPFKTGCSNDVAINETGVLNGGLWTNQTQRMRTYTKVQKRGSVGRSIDVTRYKGYDELRHDLVRMFGIEGQLEDPQSSDWKLVYVDHENDILLVGDDPWEEFVSCVQSIKILSSAEVQQMSLDGNLGNVSVPNQACSGSENGNAWRGHYDDTSAVSFNR